MRILGQQHQQGRPWLCLVDFNEILSDDEKLGGVPRPQQCINEFQAALDGCGLCDIGYEGDKFTWRNHSSTLDTYICERLDRETTNAPWCVKFSEFTVING